MLENKLNSIKEEALSSFNSAPSFKELYDLKVKYLGKTGAFLGIMKQMSELPKEERPAFGKLVNEVKMSLEKAYEQAAETLKKKELLEKMEKEQIDMTLPGVMQTVGSIHPTTQVIRDIVEIMSRIGYSVRTGPLIEEDYYNFQALNIPPDHPARDEQDTFYVDETHVLRTQTSPIQIHTMEKQPPPIRVIGPGATFRKDSDVSHSPNFHQIECLMVDRKASMADLKGTITYFAKEFFGAETKTRFRPSFFPFTEPSAEMDCTCPICKGKGCRMCKQSGWIEIGGCGLVNPHVFKMVGLEYPKWQGFAFGFGIERMAIIRYGIDDIRLFSENDVRFLKQF